MKRTLVALGGLAAVAAVAGLASAQVVFPTNAHAAFNFIPFAAGNTVMHQVFNSTLFSNATGGLPAEITQIAFAVNTTNQGQTVNLGQVTLNLGYTARQTNAAPPTGLDIPTGGGAPNASGAMTEFYNASTTVVVNTSGTAAFDSFVLNGTPFVYDPQLGNLLVEIVVPTGAAASTFSVSRAAGSADATRSFSTVTFGAVPGAAAGTATRMQFTFTAVAGCEPDITTGAVAGQPGYGVPNGVLNNDDFFYFLAQFAAGNLAVADVTTGAVQGQPGYGVPNGIINNDDFFYHLAIFAAGC